MVALYLTFWGIAKLKNTEFWGLPNRRQGSRDFCSLLNVGLKSSLVQAFEPLTCEVQRCVGSVAGTAVPVPGGSQLITGNETHKPWWHVHVARDVKSTCPGTSDWLIQGYLTRGWFYPPGGICHVRRTKLSSRFGGWGGRSCQLEARNALQHHTRPRTASPLSHQDQSDPKVYGDVLEKPGIFFCFPTYFTNDHLKGPWQECIREEVSFHQQKWHFRDRGDPSIRPGLRHRKPIQRSRERWVMKRSGIGWRQILNTELSATWLQWRGGASPSVWLQKAEGMCPTPPADGAQESHGVVDCKGMEVGSGSDSECAHCCRAKTTKTLLPEQEGRGRWGSRGH